MFDCESWDQVKWPDWVPEEMRQQLAKFWLPEWGRSPKEYLEAAILNRAPRFGLRVGMKTLRGPTVVGRFIYAWNNIGRVIDERGEIQYTGIRPFEASHDFLWCQPRPDDYEGTDEQATELQRRHAAWPRRAVAAA